MPLLAKDSDSAQQIGLGVWPTELLVSFDLLASLSIAIHSYAPQRQEFACANVLLDSIETRNFVQATLF
jgi:hypothetical protein